MNYKKGWKLYWKLFVSMFSISAFTLGGGYVIVTLMKKKFSQQYKWIEENQMLDLIAIAQSAPGPIAVNASILIGYNVAGFLGAVISILGTVFHPFVIIMIVSLFYLEFKDNATVVAILKGMSVGVAAAVVDVVITMGKSILQKKNIFSILIMLFSFIAVFVYEVNVVLIIMISGLLGLVNALYKRVNVTEVK